MLWSSAWKDGIVGHAQAVHDGNDDAEDEEGAIADAPDHSYRIGRKMMVATEINR